MTRGGKEGEEEEDPTGGARKNPPGGGEQAEVDKEQGARSPRFSRGGGRRGGFRVQGN